MDSPFAYHSALPPLIAVSVQRLLVKMRMKLAAVLLPAIILHDSSVTPSGLDKQALRASSVLISNHHSP